jgi:1-phosphofructokinase family hexose kinase
MITALVPSPALDVTYLLDEFRLGEIHRPDQVLRLAGGKGLNLARAALVLGERVEVVAALGGPTGALVARLAKAEGISLRGVAVADETRTCVSIAAREMTEIYENATPVNLRVLMAEAPTSGRLVISGSIAGDVAALERRDLAVDTSGPALSRLIDQGVGLVKVNRAEAASALGRDLPALELARLIHARGVATVVITDGASGAVAVGSTGAWRAHADPVPGQFSVGSGDSFFAGFLVGRERGWALPDSLLLASAVGSANTRRPGAGIFELAEVAAAQDRITVEAA